LLIIVFRLQDHATYSARLTNCPISSPPPTALRLTVIGQKTKRDGVSVPSCSYVLGGRYPAMTAGATVAASLWFNHISFAGLSFSITFTSSGLTPEPSSVRPPGRFRLKLDKASNWQENRRSHLEFGNRTMLHESRKPNRQEVNDEIFTEGQHPR
jgi:hypothetical protein